MPTSFVEQRFNVDISYGSKGGPSFNTTVFESLSGSEQRNINWSQARALYDVSQGIRDKADMDEILNFFYAMRGKATGFRYKDWSDYQLDHELIGTGNGAKTQFQITKTYSASGSAPYVRNIVKIVTRGDLDNAPLNVYVDDVLKADGSDYTINLNTGVITFAIAPANTKTVKVTCEFDVPVRFDTDEMEITLEAWNMETWDEIPLVEIKTGA